MSVRFDASGDRAKRTASAMNMTHTDAFTVMAWFKIITNRADYSTVFALGGSPNAHIVQTGADGVTLILWNTSVETAGSVLSVGTWYHIAHTHSTGGVHKVYLNGVQNITITDAFNVSSAEYEFGNDGSTEWANAEIDYPRMWQAELSSAEVLAEYGSATPVKASPWAYYDFTNAAGAATDSSGNSRPLTLTTLSNGASRPTFGGASTFPPVPRFLTSMPSLVAQ